MKIKSITLKDFKRFKELKIKDLPQSARLVILVGPNGSGKTSLFEAFNVVLQRSKGGASFDKEYHLRSESLFKTGIVPNWDFLFRQDKLQVQFHDRDPLDWNNVTLDDRGIFYIRSSHRHEADFTLTTFQRQGDMFDDLKRPMFMMSTDSRVSDNYQRLIADTLEGVYDGNHDNISVSFLRNVLIKDIGDSLERVLPGLKLRGPGHPMNDGTFFFDKGESNNWKYKNLSGGEKAAFDLILDFVIKSRVFKNTIFCIDEPEVHMHTGVQSALLYELLNNLPDRCQLWVATHSAAMMRAARDLDRQNPGEVIFLDFGERDFDQSVVMEPSTPDRAFWKRNFKVALGDLADLVAPEHIIFCEGSGQENGVGFDAECYERIFANEFPSTEFVSTGGVSDLQRNAFSVSAVMERIISGVRFTTVRDRDDASEQELSEWAGQGMRVLSRRTIESYLWDDEILQKLCHKLNQSDKIEIVISLKQNELQNARQRGRPADDMKSAAGNVYSGLRGILDTRGLGSTRQAFSRDTLAPLITSETRTYQELKRDIFGA